MLQVVLPTFVGVQNLETEILNISKLPFVLTGEAWKARRSQVHGQKCISNYTNEAFNKTHINLCNTTHSVTGV